jgi:DNA-binding transcriptional LysR family regulator
MLFGAVPMSRNLGYFTLFRYPVLMGITIPFFGRVKMDRLEAMSAFVAVVEAGGFSAAARRLGTPLTTVSRKVADLEDHLRVRLLTRTTRRVTLTDTGQIFFQRCRRLLDELGESERLASGEYQAPRGGLTVSAPLALGRLHLAPVVSEFLSVYPEIDVDLRLGDKFADMVQDGVDVAVRVGQLPDSSLKALRVGSIRHVICASPGYLARHGTPATPSDLSAHHCVTFTGLEGAKEWTFRSGRKIDRLTVRSRLAVNTAEAAADAATAGVGITRLLCYQVSNSVLDGGLKLLLRKFEPAPLPVSLVSPDAKLVPQKLKAFIDFVGPRLKARLIFDP